MLLVPSDWTSDAIQSCIFNVFRNFNTEYNGNSLDCWTIRGNSIIILVIFQYAGYPFSKVLGLYFKAHFQQHNFQRFNIPYLHGSMITLRIVDFLILLKLCILHTEAIYNMAYFCYGLKKFLLNVPLYSLLYM